MERLTKGFTIHYASQMDYKTELKAYRERRAKIVSMLQRKPAAVVARTFRISRQRVYQIQREEIARA